MKEVSILITQSDHHCSGVRIKSKKFESQERSRSKLMSPIILNADTKGTEKRMFSPQVIKHMPFKQMRKINHLK
jgi:hypothetical protein